MNHNPRDTFRTFGQGRSVRLPADEYIGLGKQFAITIACYDRELYLSDEELASAVMEAFLHGCAERRYRIWALCVMPEHVHAVIESECGDTPLSVVVGHGKSLAMVRAKTIAPLRWQGKFYDSVLRNQEQFSEAVEYVLNNPVAAGHVTKWTEWPWTYAAPEIPRP